MREVYVGVEGRVENTMNRDLKRQLLLSIAIVGTISTTIVLLWCTGNLFVTQKVATDSQTQTAEISPAPQVEGVVTQNTLATTVSVTGTVRAEFEK